MYLLAPTHLKVSATRLGFIVFQLWHLAVISTLSDVDSYKILILSGVVNVVSYSLLVLREIKLVNNISPLHFYLVASIFRMGFASVYFGFVGLEGFEKVMQVGPTAWWITDYLIQGHMILMVGDMAFLLGYWGIKNSGQPTMARNLPCNRKFFLSFWLAILLLLFKLIDMQISLTDSRLFHYLLMYGPPGCLFVMLKSFGTSSGEFKLMKVFLVFLLAVVMVLLALRSYMKSHLLIVLLPFIIIFIENYRQELRKSRVTKSILTALPLCVILYFFVVTMTTYSEVRRTFIGSDQYLLNRAESVEVAPFLKIGLLASIPGTQEFDTFNTFPSGGGWHFFKRLTVTNLGAWAYKEVEEIGYWDRSFFGDLLSSVIPRILWSEKPNFWPGRIFATKVGHAKSPETATTATALTMAASFYWWGGIIAVILGMSTSGLLLAATYRFVQHRQTSNPIAALVAILLLYSSLHWFEGAFYGTMQLMLYITIVFIPLVFFFERLGFKVDTSSKGLPTHDQKY